MIRTMLFIKIKYNNYKNSLLSQMKFYILRIKRTSKTTVELVRTWMTVESKENQRIIQNKTAQIACLKSVTHLIVVIRRLLVRGLYSQVNV